MWTKRSRDGVGGGRITDHLVPLPDGDLTGDERRAAAVAVLEDLQEVDAPGLGEDRGAPVVEDQQIDAGQRLRELIAASEVLVVVSREGRCARINRGGPLRGRQIRPRSLIRLSKLIALE